MLAPVGPFDHHAAGVAEDGRQVVQRVVRRVTAPRPHPDPLATSTHLTGFRFLSLSSTTFSAPFPIQILIIFLIHPVTGFSFSSFFSRVSPMVCATTLPTQVLA
jgi:hypothetical protein